MKTNLIWLLPFCFSFPACQGIEEEALQPSPKHWGPTAYQVDAVFENGSTYFYVQADSSGLLHHSFDPILGDDLPFQFYGHSFLNYREILVSSPYPIRANWFRATNPDCLDPGDTPAGIEFSIVATRERDYLLIARLDSTYWECLRTSHQSLGFSFQILETMPQIPNAFTLHGFYNTEEEQVYLKAQKDSYGVWHPTPKYLPPGSQDVSFEISKHPQLGEGQSLLRISSTMLLTPHSLWIGLPHDCLDQADWEVHINRNANRFLLDVVIPDCYLDCLNDIANGFEFEIEFYQ